MVFNGSSMSPSAGTIMDEAGSCLLMHEFESKPPCFKWELNSSELRSASLGRMSDPFKPDLKPCQAAKCSVKLKGPNTYPILLQ